MANHPEPSLEDMLLTISIARIILSPDISLQAPPNLSNRHMRYIQAGINDWGGISPVTIDFINPERAWPAIDVLAQSCRHEGYHLKERLTVYPKFINQSGKYLDDNIDEKIKKLSISGKYPKLKTNKAAKCLRN